MTLLCSYFTHGYALITIFTLLSLQSMGQQGVFFTADPTTDTYIDWGRVRDVDALDTLSDGDQLTIAFWMRWIDRSHEQVGKWANLFTMSDSSGNGDNGVFWVQHNQANSRIEYAIHTNGRNSIQSTTQVQDSVWYHIAAVYDGSASSQNMRLYINGSLESSRSKSGDLRKAPNKTKLTAGRWSNPSADYREFYGNLDEISLWNRALTEDEIDSLMVNPSVVLSSNYDTTGLIGYWDFESYDASDATSNELDGIVRGQSMLGTLPVTLVQFYGEPSVNGNALHWATEAEVNNSHFEVERSADGEFWEYIGEVTGAGNSNRTVHYSFEDGQPLIGRNLYRLRQVDYNGDHDYSEWVEVVCQPTMEHMGLDITLFKGASGMGLMIVSESDCALDYSVVGINGHIKLHRQLDVRSGQVVLVSDIDQNLPGGVYIVTARSQDVLWSQKFIR